MSSSPAIPAWGSNGLIPPIFPGEMGATGKRSPYQASLIEVIDSFCSNQARKGIFEGFLEYREKIESIGVIKGFQWLDGSFVENKESRIGKEPADIDVVTFADLPTGKTQEDLVQANPELFYPNRVKSNYKVDAFWQVLGKNADRNFVEQINYWGSLWAHTRTAEWKGFVQVDICPNETSDAKSYLAKK